MYSIACVSLSYDTRNVFSLFSLKYMGSCPLNRKKHTVQNTRESQVHKITNTPVFYMGLGLMILMGANPLLGPLEGVGPEILNFFGSQCYLLRLLP
jgi:hypothetical protein